MREETYRNALAVLVNAQQRQPLAALFGAADVSSSDGRKWPPSLPTSFLRSAWREAVLGAGAAERRTWEAATLLALRDRLRSGDIWVEGSRQWRAIEDQLIPPALFAAMRGAGPLPVAAPATAEAYLAERRALLERRLSEVAGKAAMDGLEDVRIKDPQKGMSSSSCSAMLPRPPPGADGPRSDGPGSGAGER